MKINHSSALPALPETHAQCDPAPKTRATWRKQQMMTGKGGLMIRVPCVNRIPSLRAIEVTKQIEAAETLMNMRDGGPGGN